MNVTCPNCATIYRVDPAKVPEAGVRARCAVCAAVFPVRRDASAGTSTASAATAPSAPAPSPAPPSPAPAAADRPAPVPARAEEVSSREVAAGAPVTPAPAASPAPAGPPVAPPPPSPARPEPPVSRPETAPRPVAPAAPVVPPAAPRPAVSRPAGLPPVAPAPRPVSSRPPTAPAAPSAGPGAGGAARKPVNPFLSQDPGQKARRLARALISDMVVYHPAKRREGLRDGTLKTLFEDEIKKSWEEYTDQVGKDVAESTTHFKDALNEILADGRQIF